MATEREMLKYAAKAMQKFDDISFRNFSVCDHAICLELGHKRGAITSYWNPLTNPGDTAEMCAKLLIDTCFYLQLGRVTCDFYYGTDNIRDRVRVEFKDHDNSRLKAWMYAATMVAAKIGEME